MNHDGEVFDFHALRHTCGAWLALAGAPPQVVKTVMRHSTITLTMDTYGHLFDGQEAEAVADLGNLLAVPPEALAATGTDDVFVEQPSAGAQRRAQQTRRDPVRSDTKASDAPDRTRGAAAFPNPLQIAEMDDTLLSGATQSDTPAPLAQLAEQLTLNQ